MTRKTAMFPRPLLLLAALLTACGGTGTVRFTTYGEDFIEQGIPSSEVVDGWGVSFSRFLVVIGEVQLADHAGTVAGAQQVPKVFDLVLPGPAEVEVFADVAAQRWDAVSFAIAPVETAIAGNASAEDTLWMTTARASVHVEGIAARGAEERRFTWTFTSNTLYDACDAGELGAGVVLPVSGEENVELTIHGDHLLYDDLIGDDAELRFDAIAAADVSPADGVVTLEELRAVDLTELPADQYGTGNVAGVHTLGDFVETVVKTIGHFRGEGECRVRSR